MKTQMLVLCLAAAATMSAAPVLSLSPSTQSITAGSPVSVDIVIAGLGAEGRALGAYTGMTVGFDQNLLTPDLVVVSNRLGDASDFSQLLYSVNTFFDGQILLDVASLLDSATLFALQSSPTDSFVLATLQFNTIGFGTSNLLLTPGALADELGNAIDPAVVNAAVTVTGASAVPEPSAYLLMAGGLAALGCVRARRT